MNKIERQQRDNNRRKVLDVLQNSPGGMLSVDISASTGISINTVKRILIFLRSRGEVCSKLAPNKKRTQLWIYGVEVIEPPPAAKSIDVPYPDLDKDHEEWLMKQKPIYNPWGRSC